MPKPLTPAVGYVRVSKTPNHRVSRHPQGAFWGVFRGFVEMAKVTRTPTRQGFTRLGRLGDRYWAKDVARWLG